MLVVDRRTISFPDFFAHIQCFLTGSSDVAKWLAGIPHDDSVFHLLKLWRPSELGIPAQALVYFTSYVELCFIILDTSRVGLMCVNKAQRLSRNQGCQNAVGQATTN